MEIMDTVRSTVASRVCFKASKLQEMLSKLAALMGVVKYLSNATSTFIIRVSRDHYRLAWTALSFMTKVPGVRDGKSCVYRVVRVSGTIRKAQEEAIRRARELILTAQREQNEKSESTLDGILGKAGLEKLDSTNDVHMVDRSDSEDGEGSDDG